MLRGPLEHIFGYLEIHLEISQDLGVVIVCSLMEKSHLFQPDVLKCVRLAMVALPPNTSIYNYIYII